MKNWRFNVPYLALMASTSALFQTAGMPWQAAGIAGLGAYSFLYPWPLGSLVQSRTHGTARFARWWEIQRRGLLSPSGVIVGRYKGRLLRFAEAGHLITFAPTRSGKGAGQIIPTLLTWQGSVLVNDIKGENHAVTRRARRKMGQDVYPIAPGRDDSAKFNPLHCIRRDPSKVVDDCGQLADLLLPRSKNGSSSEHFDQAAFQVVRGLILYAVLEKGDAAHMGHVCGVLNASRDDFDGVLGRMEEHDNEHVRSTAHFIRQREDKERSGILSTAVNKLDVWTYPQIRAVANGRSDFTFEDMKRRPMSVYLIIPPDKKSDYAAFMRVVIGMANAAMTRDQRKACPEVLFLLDEFPALGHMKSIESGIAELAGYGVKYWVFCQNTAQLSETYKDGWKTFVANCAVQSYFGVNDFDTARFLSDSMGRKTVGTKSRSESAGGVLLPDAERENTTTGETARSLLNPDEIMVDKTHQFVRVQGMRTIQARKVRYWKAREFRGLYDRWQS